ncbi:MAG: hypothetical protein M1834_002164 [Cirrosporium novae-zelandiae]|nr:MAG: hypothetical protein M1834_002164 [Cirrosporium novae-zelandiae]
MNSAAEPRALSKQLKPLCVELLKLALDFDRGTASGRDVTNSIQDFYRILSEVATEGSLDSKLAEYTFLPLGHVFRQSKQLPLRCNELAIRCLRFLVADGWGLALAPELAKQILILLVFFLDQKSNAAVKVNREELKIATYECMVELFKVVSASSSCKGLLADTALLPGVGQLIVSLLEDANQGESQDVQLAAISVLEAFSHATQNKDLLAQFLPGIVSSLSKALQPERAGKHTAKVLSSALVTLTTFINATLSDAVNDDSTSDQSPEGWLNATASQVKIALGTIIHLRRHEREKVRSALLQLCMTILDQCARTLANCKPMLIETVLVLASQKQVGNNQDAKLSLQQLIARDPEVIDISKSSLDTWTTALPRVLSSNDDNSRERLLDQIFSSLNLLSNYSDECTHLVQEVVIPNICSGIAGAVHGLSLQKSNSNATNSNSLQLISTDLLVSKSSFQPVLLNHNRDKVISLKLESIARLVALSPMFPQVTRSILNQLLVSSGEDQIASLWFGLKIFSYYEKEVAVIDEFIDIDDSSISTFNNLVGELYATALSFLPGSAYSESTDPRLPCLALEVIGFQARRLKTNFRPELMDTLYPILHFMGSSNPVLSSHAMVCLNVTSSACAYPSVRELIVDNVDYLVNAIGLKLNTFDISPQAPQVLSMIVKLCGPSLLPYLDDLVASLFTALDCFHGYPDLVERLFAVLATIVEEGSKGADKMIEEKKSDKHLKKPYTPPSIEEVTKLLSEKKEKEVQTHNPRIEELLDEETPQTRWKSEFNSKIQKTESEPDQDMDDEDSLTEPSKGNTSLEESKPTTSQTLLHRISTFSQYHLTSPSPLLRQRILHLLSTSIPTLSQSEDTFLPLINDLWPVVLHRLYDPEPFVKVAAANVIVGFCTGAGDFMAGRVRDEWKVLTTTYQKTYKRVQTERKNKGKDARFVPEYQVWEAFVKLLVAVAGHVRLDLDMEDDIVGMLADEISTSREIRDALTALNPDAVWLETVKRGSGRSLLDVQKVPPQLEEEWVFKPVVV